MIRPSEVRRGFTIIEALTVFAILGVLLALLLPAISAARISARIALCRMRVASLATAVTLYHDVHGMTPIQMNSDDYASGWTRAADFLDGAASASGERPNFPFRSRSTPNIVYHEPNPKFFRPLDHYFVCPAATGIGRPAEPGTTYYENEAGELIVSQSAGPSSYAMNWGVAFRTLRNEHPMGMFDSIRPLRFRDATAGLSKVALLSEVVAVRRGLAYASTSSSLLPLGAGDMVGIDNVPNDTLGGFAERCARRGRMEGLELHRWLGSSWYHADTENSRYTHSLTPGQISCISSYVLDYAITTAGSEHHDLVNVAMVDGSVQSVGYNIDADVWRRMGHREGENVF